MTKIDGLFWGVMAIVLTFWASAMWQGVERAQTLPSVCGGVVAECAAKAEEW